jgi:hypothetical protein
MTSKNLHLVVRFSDTMFGVGDVVAKHNIVVAKHGYVWFGKLGTGLSASRIDMLNEQISKEITTFVYFVKGNRKKSTAYRAHLIAVAKELPNGQSKYVPHYYSENNILQFMKAWLKIDEIIPAEWSELRNLRAISSISSIQETLTRSSSGYFLVVESASTF